MKKLKVFDKYETPYSWKESVRSGVPRKKEKPYPRRLVTALQIGLAVIAVCSIGAFVIVFNFNGVTDSGSANNSHSGDYSTVITNPNTKPDTPDSSNTGLIDYSVSGRVTKFRNNGYMIITEGAVSYNVKVPDVVVDSSRNKIIELTDEAKSYIEHNNLNVRVKHNGEVVSYNNGLFYPQINDSYTLSVDLSGMTDDYQAPEVSDELVLLDNAFDVYCGSFEGCYNAYSDELYDAFVGNCEAVDDDIVVRVKNNTDFIIKRLSSAGLFSDYNGDLNTENVASVYRIIFALSSKDGMSVHNMLSGMINNNTVVSNSGELAQAGLKIEDGYGEAKYFYYDSTPDTIYVVMCIKFVPTSDMQKYGIKKMIADGTPIEFVIGNLSNVDASAIADGRSKLLCFCKDSSDCKHSTNIKIEEKNILIAASIMAKDTQNQPE